MARRRRSAITPAPVSVESMQEEASEQDSLVLDTAADTEPLPEADSAPEMEPSPAAKIGFCSSCDVRFVPTDGLICDDCIAAEARRRVTRPGYTRCRVVGSVVAMGMVEDGHFKTTFADGDVAEFAAEDVASLPDCLVAVEE
jgi:hypothetical protein